MTAQKQIKKGNQVSNKKFHQKTSVKTLSLSSLCNSV